VIDLESPPIVTVEEHGLVVTCADVRLGLWATLDDTTSAPLVTLSLGLSAPIAVAPDADGVLQVEIGALAITADALDAPPGFIGGEDLDEILAELAPLLTASALDFGGVQMPSLMGFTFEEPLYSVGDNIVRLDATLTYAPPSAE